MLKLQESSLDWALTHIEKYGDTDIFPIPFEFKAIRADWNSTLRGYLRTQDLLNWEMRAYRRCLTPKHRFGFRIATQLDPLDCIIFNALVYEIGNEIEKSRVPKEDKAVYSYRFQPTIDGDMYDENYNWRGFQNRCEELSNPPNRYKFVVVADIADFYPRIYLHPLENALDSCTTKNNHVKKITSMLKDWNYSVSYGIPVGPTGTRLLAELAIDDIDRGLMSEGMVHCRYVDDYRIFCESEKEAYENLAFLANILFENHGLTLQQHKTKILTVEKFKDIYLKSENRKEFDNLSERFSDILNKIEVSPYEKIDYDELSPEMKQEIDGVNLIDILNEQVNSEEIDGKLISFILRRLGQLDNPFALPIVLENIDKLYIVFKNILNYIQDLNSLTADVKSEYGRKLLVLLEESIVGHLEYHRAWLFGLFANDQEWNSKDKYVSLYNNYKDQFSQRKIILALGKSDANYWFKSNKRNITQLSPWIKRAFLAAASCLPGDESYHWYRSIDRSLDPLEKTVVKWAKDNF